MSGTTGSRVPANLLGEAGAVSGATRTDSRSHESTGSDATGYDAVGIPEIATSSDDTSAVTTATAAAPEAEKDSIADSVKQPLPEEVRASQLLRPPTAPAGSPASGAMGSDSPVSGSPATDRQAAVFEAACSRQTDGSV